MIVSQFTTQGVRDRNQDTIYPEPGQLAGDLFIVADGLGGHADGKIASELACCSVREIVEHEDPASFVLGGHRMDEPELMEAFLSDAVRQAGAAVWHEARQRGSDMGSTLLVVLLKNGKGYGAHVGDCALFVSEAGKMPPVKLTTEHRRGASLTRSLGAQEQVTPDVFSFTFDNESALVMGCDGFWEHVSSERIGQLLLERPPFCVAEELGYAALESGSQDNVSIVVIEGDTFVTQHVARQIESYAAVLAERDNSPESATQHQLLLEFCTQHVTSSASVPKIIAQLLKHIPGAAQVWGSIRESLPQEIQDEITQLAGDAVLSPDEVQAREFAARERHDDVAFQAYQQYLAAHPDDGAVRLHCAFSLLEQGDFRQAFVEVERAVTTDPRLSSQARTWLSSWMKSEPSGESDLELYERYLAFVPDDNQLRCAFGIRLWESGDQRRGWAELRRLYTSGIRWQESISSFFRENRVSVDTSILREHVEMAMQTRGPGVVWALEELVRRDPSSRPYAEDCAAVVRAGWPVPGESQAAQRWLESLAAQAAAPQESGSRELEQLERIERLEMELARRQRELESAKHTSRQLQEQISDLQTRLEQSEQQANVYKESTLRLGRFLLEVSARYPQECEDVLTSELLVKVEDWLRSQGVVRSLRKDQPPPEDKKSWLPSWLKR